MEFLRQIEEQAGVTCVIAGGFVRDSIIGRPFRDVDLYVPYDGHGFSKVYKALTGNDDDGYAVTDESSDEYVHQSIQYQIEVEPASDWQNAHPLLLQGHSVNIIGLNSGTPCTGTEIVARYNLGICQAWISKESYATEGSFSDDVRDKQITLLRSEWGYEATFKQWIKLQSKYRWPLRMSTTESHTSDLFQPTTLAASRVRCAATSCSLWCTSQAGRGRDR